MNLIPVATLREDFGLAGASVWLMEMILPNVGNIATPKWGIFCFAQNGAMCYLRHMDYYETYNRNRVDYLYQLARCPELTPIAVRVGLLFATFLQPDERETVRPKYDWLMENAFIGSRGTLSKALRDLENEGFLERVTYNGWGTRYSLPFDGESEWRRKRPAVQVKKRTNKPKS